MLLKTCYILVTCKLCFKALLVSSNVIPAEGLFGHCSTKKETLNDGKKEIKKERR
jgi:hypothetical protein